MFLNGLGTAVPADRYTQAECWQALQIAPSFQALSGRSQTLLRKVFSGENGISTRHLSVENLEEMFALTPDALHQRFTQAAPVLATQAAERALANARISAEEVDAVIVSTCTGYLCPGLTSYVGERLGLRPDALPLDLVGQGCGAALPNWRTAESLLGAGRARHVLSVCVEVCSAAFYLDNDPGVLISTCLFGDGAAAAVLSADPLPHARRVEWKTAGSIQSPGEREYLRFDHRGGMLRNILTREVPDIAAGHVDALLEELLARESLTKADVSEWILHAGGREVLAALRAKLQLSEGQVRRSAEVLGRLGNVSSPCVMFVMEQALAEQAAGGWWWMTAFGAGFSCHGALLKVE